MWRACPAPCAPATTLNQSMLKITLVGGPTVVLDFAGLRWLTDPAFSPPGEYAGLVKTTAPALEPEAIEPIDVVLLSHEHHSDNLDPAGRERTTTARSTPAAHCRCPPQTRR